jgi:hypothetical protein
MASSLSKRGIPGRILCLSHRWFVSFQHPQSGEFLCLPVSEADAWNFDIENNLPVLLKLRDGKATLISRKGNKKYVKISAAG